MAHSPDLPDDSPTAQAPAWRPSGFTLPQPDGQSLTPQAFENVPFADLPLYIPNLSNPIVGFDGGLNRAALVVSPLGVLCILPAYLGQAENDFIELFLDGNRVDFHTVDKEEADNGRPINLYVESSRFVREAGNPLQAVVTRFSGGSDQTLLFNIYVDVEIPGGRNPVDSSSENENLPKPVFPQDIIDFGVDEEAARNGVPVIIGYYPRNPVLPAVHARKAYDLIRLSIGGVILEHRVTELEAAGQAPITLTILADTWAEVGSGVHVCEWNVIDEVGNWSDGYSPAQLLEVRLDDGAEPLLPTAYILESVERPGNSDLLDVDALNGDDATIGVDVTRLGYVLGDIIRARIVGRTVDGVTISYVYDHPIDSTTRPQNIPWPNADILPLIGGRILLTYQRIRSGELPRNSEGNRAELIGTPVEAELEAPQVPTAPGNELPATTNPVPVVVKTYTGQNENDLVTLILEGAYANGRPYYKEQDQRAGTNDQDVIIEVLNGPNGDIRQLEGGWLRLYYKINNAQERPPSRSRTLQVVGQVASLPAPVSEQVVPPDYVFDPDIETGNLSIRVLSNPAFTEGSTVYLHFEGSAAGGSAPPIEFPIDNNWVGRNLPFTIPRAFVIANLNGSARTYYRLEKTGEAPRTSDELVFRVGPALSLPVPEVLEGTPINPTETRLNPLRVLPPNPEVVTVRVRYVPMLPADDIKVRIVGKPGVGAPDIPAQPAIPLPGNDFVDITVPNAFVGAYLGQECSVYYDVIRAGKDEPSDTLTLRVEALAAQEWDLVSIPEAIGGEIDTSKANTVSINGWPFMQAGQLLYISLRSPAGLFPLLNRAVTSAEAVAKRVSVPIPAEYLGTLTPGSLVQVEASVSLDGSGNLDTAQPFTVPIYRVSVHFEDLTTFEKNSRNGWVVGPAARPGDVYVSTADYGGRWLVNTTTGSENIGIVLQKTFPALIPGKSYTFSIDAGNTRVTVPFNPILSLSTDTGDMSTPTELITAGPYKLSLDFTAYSSTTQVRINSHVRSGNGNDYYVDNLKVTSR